MTLDDVTPAPDTPGDLPVDPETSFHPESLRGGVPDSSAGEAFDSGAEDGPRHKSPGVTTIPYDPAPDTVERPRPVPPSGLTPLSHRFVFRQPIASGGHGEVWEALQVSLRRIIAVKRIKEDNLTSSEQLALEWAFHQEALTAAHLEHPNIVPVYDLGQDEFGRPLLAMKRVKGSLWNDLIRQDFRTLPTYDYLLTHLPVLIQVAQAVAFAHSHGILHRDLKASQVMIGRHGEVLLMDWGLAMAYQPEQSEAANSPLFENRDSPLFHPTNPAGTPSCMAPEQTEKSPERLGPWTDVYLLGGILYHLLTGRCVHSAADSETAFRQASEGRVIPPEQAAPEREIPRVLSELALRALALEPRDRDLTAWDFAFALRDYLTGADKRRESLQLHAQVAEQLDSADIRYAALTEALNQLDRCLVLWPENRPAEQLRRSVLGRYARAALANRDLTLARLQAERLPKDPEQQLLLREINELEEHQRRQDELLEQAYRQAHHERDIAEQARQRAEHMRSRAENLVQFLLGDLHRDLWPIGRLDLLYRVAKKSLEYFDSLPESESTDSVLHNRAIAYLRIGDVLSDQGKKLEAGEAYRKARDIMRQLVEREPEKTEWNRTLADSHESHGQVLYYQGNTAEALFEHTKALGIREWIAQRFPEDSAIHKDVASSRHRMGVVFWRQQDLQRALAFHLDALETYRRLTRDTPEDLSLLASTAWALSTLGNVHRDLGQLDEAVEVTREGLAIRESLAAREPNNTVRLDDVLWTRSNLALLLLLQSKLEESLELFRKDMELRRQLVKADPENVVRLNSLTFCMSLAAEVLFALNRIGEAEFIVTECLELSKSLMGRDSASSQAVAAHARLSGQLAEYLAAQQRWEEAEPHMRTAGEIARKAVEKAPHSVMSIKVLIVNLVLGGRVAMQKGDNQLASESWEEAWRLLQSLKITDQELDVLDLNAQLLLLRQSPDEAAGFIERLRARRWITPTLRAVCRETGYPLAD